MKKKAVMMWLETKYQHGRRVESRDRRVDRFEGPADELILCVKMRPSSCEIPNHDCTRENSEEEHPVQAHFTSYPHSPAQPRSNTRRGNRRIINRFIRRFWREIIHPGKPEHGAFVKELHEAFIEDASFDRGVVTVLGEDLGELPAHYFA